MSAGIETVISSKEQKVESIVKDDGGKLKCLMSAIIETTASSKEEKVESIIKVDGGKFIVSHSLENVSGDKVRAKTSHEYPQSSLEFIPFPVEKGLA